MRQSGDDPQDGGEDKCMVGFSFFVEKERRKRKKKKVMEIQGHDVSSSLLVGEGGKSSLKSTMANEFYRRQGAHST